MSSTLSPWEHYESFPKSLWQHDPLLDDAAAQNQRLADEGTRLFTSKDNISIDVLDICRDEFVEASTFNNNTFKTSESFEKCLQDTSSRDSRFYIFKPSNPKVVSRCPLHISEEMTRKVLTTHNVMPAFLDHIHAFGRRENREHDASFGGGRYKVGFVPRSNECLEYELCYTYKFAVHNGRKADSDPFSWSIRQTSVYQKFQYNQKQSTWILVQPSDAVRHRLEVVLKESSSEAEKLTEPSPVNPLKTHLLFLSAASENWRNYYNTLEQIFYEMTKAAVNFQIPRSLMAHASHRGADYEGKRDPLEQFEVDFQDVQDLQQFEELLRRVKTAMEINEDAIRSLRDLNSKLQKICQDDSFSSAWMEIDIESEQQLAIMERHKRNIESLLRNVHGRARLLYNVLDFKNALTVSHQGQRAVDIKQLQRSESTMMMMLNEITVRDAVGVKILTILATLYLPASFVATFLSAGIVSFDKSRATPLKVDFNRMAISNETIIFYLAFTIPLMLLTYGCWWIWERRSAGIIKKRLTRSRTNPGHSLTMEGIVVR